MDLYFAYGSNMNFEQMERRCPGASVKGRAYLKGWRYFINGNGYAGIERWHEGIVWGGVWELKEFHWNALDQYEAVDHGFYSRVQIRIQLQEAQVFREIKVFTYLSNNYDYGSPTSDYQEIVLKGGGDLKLDEEYLFELSKWKN